MTKFSRPDKPRSAARPKPKPKEKPRRGPKRPPAPPKPAGPERIQKLMARAGLGSRRGLEKQIEAGEISLNGKRAALGATVTEGDKITFADRHYVVECGEHKARVLIYNKPVGEVTTRSDEQGRPTVFDRMPRLKGERWVSVGRLDMNTSGLLLLTTDGELANAMMHPSANIDREYACRVRGEMGEEMRKRLLAGVELDDGMAAFSDIVPSGGDGQNHWYHVVIMEGRNREVRRLWESQGMTVSRLKRVRYGPVFLPSRLKVGMFEDMDPKDVKVMRQDIGLTSTVNAEQLTLKATRSG